MNFFTDFDDDIFAGLSKDLEIGCLSITIQLVLADKLSGVFD
jgi:hypothetical protein